MCFHRFGLMLLACWPLLRLPANAQINVLTYHNDNGRTGQNLSETLLTPASVNVNSFGKLFTYAVDGYLYAQPLYVSALTIPGQGTHNVVFVATEHNTVYSFDADNNSGAAGGLLWQTNLGPSAATPNSDFGTRFGGFTSIVPEVGITGTPVIDLASGTLFVDAFTHEGSAYIHRVHALNIADGTERSFSPVIVSASVAGHGVESVNGMVHFDPKQQIQRCALTLAGGILYIAYAGYDDTDPYHGWIIGYDPATLQQLPAYVFNTTPNSTTTIFGPHAGEGGIWMAGCGLSADAGGSLYFGVGNGVFNAFNRSGGTEYGDSFIRLSTSGQLAVADYFTPYNQSYLAANNVDIGSGGVLLLPDQPGPFAHLMVGGGKEAKLYLMNRDQMTTGNNHYNSGGSSDEVVQTVALGGAVMHTPAYFNGNIYTGASSDTLAAFPVINGLIDDNNYQVGPRVLGYPGATPSVSANGANNGIIWLIANSNPALLAAYDAANITTEIYNSAQAAGGRDQLTNGVKFAVPTIANGKVYVGGQYQLAVFGLLGAGTLQFSSSTYTAAESSGVATITVNRMGTPTGAAQVGYATVPGGTAIDGTNYQSTSGTLTWPDGDGSPKNFTVTLLDDHLATPNNTINLALNSATGAATLGTPASAVLTIVEPPYETWKFAHFGDQANTTAIAGDQADPDGDGLINLLEYAVGSDPNVANSHSPVTAALNADQFQLQFNRNLSATDLTYVIQSSVGMSGSWTNLMTFTTATGWMPTGESATVSESAPSGSPPDQSVTVTFSEALTEKMPGAACTLYRVSISR